MKAKQILTLILLLLVVSLAREAQAFYNPSTGRWLNRDPFGESGGRNFYGFADDNPIANIDRLGLVGVSTWDQSIGIGTVGNGTQLALWSRLLFEDSLKFQQALIALCPCKETDFMSLNGKTQKCTSSSCVAQAVSLTLKLRQAYTTVFTTEYNKFGDIQYGWNANDRANDAPHHGMVAEDYDKGFGLKCAGWQSLSGLKFIDTIQPFHVKLSQCFRAAGVAKDTTGGLFDHSWVVIYGPARGPLNMTMFKKGDYDIVVDPWPRAGASILGHDHYSATRMDYTYLW